MKNLIVKRGGLIRKRAEKSFAERTHPFYFIIPSCIIYFLFFLLPISLNLWFGFTDWNTFTDEIKFNGITNFKIFFEDGLFFLMLKNTIVFTLAAVILQNIFAFSLALVLSKKSKINQLFRAIFFIPCVVAIVVWGFLFKTILEPKGLLNNFFSFIFNTDISIAWLGSRNFSIFIVGLVTVWIWTGFTMMIYVASINSIPVEIIESAKIDGVGWFGMIKNMIIPLIMPGVTINIIMTTIGCLKVFDIVMVLTRGGPGRGTTVFNILIYDMFASGRLGYASSINLFLIIFIAAITIPVYIKLSSMVVES